MKLVIKMFLRPIVQRGERKSERSGLFIVCVIITALFVFVVSPAAQQRVSAQTATRSKKAAQNLEAETLLDRLGYRVAKVDGAADASTRHALVAFQKVEGRRRTGILNETELKSLRTASRPAAKFNGAAHVEVDITRQVLFLVDENAIVKSILPISSGNEEKYFDEQAGKWAIAHTPRGEFQIKRQIFGVRRAPLGNLYYPNYFTGGVAIHGSPSIPVFPASHGCVRIPNFAAREFQTLVSVGMPVMVYD